MQKNDFRYMLNAAEMLPIRQLNQESFDFFALMERVAAELGISEIMPKFCTYLDRMAAYNDMMSNEENTLTVAEKHAINVNAYHAESDYWNTFHKVFD